MRKTLNKFFAGATAVWIATAVIMAGTAAPLSAAISLNSVGSAQIIDRSIKAVDIATGAINSFKIADEAVRRKHINSGAVDSSKIADGSIKWNDIADEGITTPKISDGSGSGLDSDMVDGLHSSEIVAKLGDQVMTGKLTAPDLNYAFPKTGYLSVPGNSFGPSSDTVQFSTAFFDINAAGAGTSVFFAPITVPHGAKITGFKLVGWDNSGYDISAVLNRRSNVGATDDIAGTGSTGSSASYRPFSGTVADTYSNVDNTVYSYFIRLELRGEAGSNTRVNRFQIDYTYTSPGS